MAQHRKAVRQLEAGYTCAVDTDARAREALQRGGVHIQTSHHFGSTKSPIGLVLGQNARILEFRRAEEAHTPGAISG